MSICRICGRPEEDHHVFDGGPLFPEGCVCDPYTWNNEEISPICEKYVGNGLTYCERCEHDLGCHVK